MAALLLSRMIGRQDYPLSKGQPPCPEKHKLLGRADAKWLGLFQACCLNFDKAICDLFGSRSTLSHELSFAIQFTEMNLEQRYQITGVFPVRPADFGGRKAKPPISRVF